jgi:hypothetical protein
MQEGTRAVDRVPWEIRIALSHCNDLVYKHDRTDKLEQ